MMYRIFCLTLCSVGLVLAVKDFNNEAFIEQLEDGIESLRDELDWLQFKHINLITRKVSKTYDPLDPTKSESAIVSAVSAFISKEAGPFGDTEDDLEVFDEIFETYIIDACHSIVSELNPAVKVYDENMESVIALKELDAKSSLQSSLQWLTNAKICKEIIQDESTIYVDVLVNVMGAKHSSHRMTTRSAASLSRELQ